MASSQEGEKAKLELSTESFDFRLYIVVFEQILEGIITESGKAKNKLQDVTIGLRMKQDEKSPVFLASKIELTRVKAKLKCLLEQMKSVQEVEELESQSWKMRLGVNVEKAESVLQEIPEEEGLDTPELEMQVEEDIAKSELLIEEAELIRVVKKVESPMLEIQLKEHISKVESVLQSMKLVREESNVESLELRMQLEDLEFLLEKLKSEQQSGELESLLMEIELEGHVVKLKLLLEGTKERLQWSQMLEMELKNDIEKLKFLQVSRFVWGWSMDLEQYLGQYLDAETSLLEKMESLGEKSRIMQLKEHTADFESLLKDMKSVKLEAKLKLRGFKKEFHIHTVKKHRLEKKLEQDESRLKELAAKSEILWNEIKLKREKEGEKEKGHLAKLKNCIAEMNSLLRNIKQDDVLVWKESLRERTATCPVLLQKMKMVQRELEFSTWEMELNQRHIQELEFLLREEMRLKQKKTLGIELLERLEFLAKEIESEPDVEIPMFAAFKKTLQDHLGKKNEGKRKERRMFPQGRMKLEREKEKLEFSTGAFKSQLTTESSLPKEKELMTECSWNLKTVNLKEQKRKTDFPASEMKSSTRSGTFPPGEQQAPLTMELCLPEEKNRATEYYSNLMTRNLMYNIKPDLLAFVLKVKRKREKLASLTGTGKIPPRKQQAPSTLIESQSVIVIGGRGRYGESLSSVEVYIFLEGRWIGLPAMNTPRSFMSSVVVGQEVIVSGGDTGDAITDTIEVLDLAESPLQWKISPAKLPVPLSAHQTVVYRGKLIVIGGHDDNEGRNSDKIYEVLLTPPYTNRILSLLPRPRAWHGAELVNNKVFILGGGGNSWFPTDDVFVYDLCENRYSAMSNLPYGNGDGSKGMATVRKWDTVMLLGGVDKEENELREVISYDIESGTVTSF